MTQEVDPIRAIIDPLYTGSQRHPYQGLYAGDLWKHLQERWRESSKPVFQIKLGDKVCIITFANGEARAIKRWFENMGYVVNEREGRFVVRVSPDIAALAKLTWGGAA